MEIYCVNVHNIICKKLLNVSWLNKLGFKKSLIDDYIKSYEFLNTLCSMVDNKDFTCKSTLNLLNPLINALIKDKNLTLLAPNDWLTYIYEFTLHNNFPDASSITIVPELTPICDLYLKCLRVICDTEKINNGGSFISKYPLKFLTSKEEQDLENKDEYLRFIRSFNNFYVYEMMKLNGEITGFNTLEHICGVHHLALFIARQLKSSGINIDLGRVSGAAAGHDIGKYGCKKSEMKRVPYLHYYYSDQWLKDHNIHYIRHIAVNHSTWDLELENLSLENLILIYSDFRVKNTSSKEGVKMHIFTLQESFKIILDKLDNVDEAKENRYKRVYEKLQDFESFLISINIKTNIYDLLNPINPHSILSKKDFALTQGYEVVCCLKYMAIEHNINLMYTLRDEVSLETLLEKARSEKDWKNLREYIKIFEEYSTYLTQKQKLQTMNFLYENLIHPEDDIRNQCAKILGSLIAIYDEKYRKEIPLEVATEFSDHESPKILEKYINLMLFPSHKIISDHRYWLGYSLSTLVKYLFSNCNENMVVTYRKVILSFFNANKYKNSESYLFLLECCKFIPLSPYDDSVIDFYNFIYSMLSKRNSILRLSALESSIDLISNCNFHELFIDNLTVYLNNSTKRSLIPSENLLRYNLCKTLNLEELMPTLKENCINTTEEIQEIFLSNLKSATTWVKKKYQVSLLLDEAYYDKNANPMHTALHFCNLLKVSAVEGVRNAAGNAILNLMPKLNFSEKNEIAVELVRALEMEENKFTEYIPKYLGQIFLYLPPTEFDEIVDDLCYKIKISKTNVKSLLLKTLGFTLEFYDNYKTRFHENKCHFEERRKTLLGIVLNGLGDYNNQVKQSSLGSIGKGVFGSKDLSLKQKNVIFNLIAKKLLTLLVEEKENELLFLSNCATLNHIYRFISDYSFFLGNIDLPIPRRVAFFPGTFDPFSLSHKEIAKRIRDLGFQVYLAVDEFSWSKKTLPNLLRRSILNMSIASEIDMFIYPDTYPTNIANDSDLLTLKNNFKNSEVYIVVGADVIVNASSYRKDPTENSIHNFSHIIFERNKLKNLDKAIKNINGNVEILNLPNKYTDISSTQIRNYIDENRDISRLVDPLAQQYIYENGFYQREPLNKIDVKPLSLDVEVFDNFNNTLLQNISNLTFDKYGKTLCEKIIDTFKKPSGRVILLKDSYSGKILGFSLFHWSRSSMLYEDIKDVEIAKNIRNNSLGRIILLDELYIHEYDKNKTILPILLTETLAFCISRDYEFAVFKSSEDSLTPYGIDDLLKLYGFKEITDNSKVNIFLVNMSNPCIISFDIENHLKEPFRSNNKIKNVINSTRIKFQKAICKLFPGQLVLPFDINMVYQGMIKKVCNENNVPTKILNPRTLGDYMCVPYGDILDRYIIPNTVTKSLHSEKYFHPDMNSFDIKESPRYLNLKNQIKMLKSFNREVILVDNILHKGYRIRALDPLFKEQGINVRKIITGILSGNGKDIMDYQERAVDSVYFIPRLKIWFNENDLYPFIGGDSLWRGKFPERNLLPSVNLILPYTSPVFIRGASKEAIYEFSKVCIENSIEIFKVLEKEYHNINERNLNLHCLGHVFNTPRAVDHGNHIKYDLNLSPIYYLNNDLEALLRFENIVRR